MDQQQQQQPGNGGGTAVSLEERQIQRHNAQLARGAAEQFSRGVADLLLAAEELRQSVVVVVRSGGSGGDSEKKIGAHRLLQWQWQADRLAGTVPDLERWCADATVNGDGAAANRDLLAHCLQKAAAAVGEAWEAARERYAEPVETGSDIGSNADNDDEVDVSALRRDAQGAVARLAHVGLLLRRWQRRRDGSSGSDGNKEEEQRIIQQYVEYQRQVLRQRAKPAIAALVQERRKGTFAVDGENTDTDTTTTATTTTPKAVIVHDSDDEHDHHGARVDPLLQHHHAPALTVVLGEAATLIHPLAAWRAALDDGDDDSDDALVDDDLRQLCRDSIRTLDEQAQALMRTVSDWFGQDRPVDRLLGQANEKASASGSNSTNNTAAAPQQELARLDSLVQEMADTCQVLERYQTLVAAVRSGDGDDDDENGTTTTNTSTTQLVIPELLQEWTLKYGALERYLALRQWSTALRHAGPVVIVLGTEIRVPSTVEDAQYLTNRALQRAAAVSPAAAATVAWAVARDVWAVGSGGGSEQAAVYQALENQLGCWSSELQQQQQSSEKDSDGKVKTPPSSGFASALLEALDEDTGPGHHHQQSAIPAAAPPSGGFLTSLLDKENQQQRELDTTFCLLNGMQAASAASRALVIFLDSLLLDDDDDSGGLGRSPDDERATRLMQQAREDLARSADTYQALLRDRVQQSLERWCGDPTGHDAAVVSVSQQKGCFCDLQLFLERENYQLDGRSIGPAEADERLERELIGPLRESKYLQQLRDKCELEVLQVTAERVAAIVVEVVLQTLWSQHVPKKFNDWGSLLFSKQVRLLQIFVSTTLLQPSTRTEAAPPAVPAAFTAQLLQIWERLSQVTTVLQLEKPSDWLLYHSTSVLKPDELAKTFALRVDFSTDAVKSTVTKCAATKS